MKLKIISDGTPRGTKLIDTASGESVDDIVNIKWEITVGKTAMLEVTLLNTEVDLYDDHTTLNYKMNRETR